VYSKYAFQILYHQPNTPSDKLFRCLAAFCR